MMPLRLLPPSPSTLISIGKTPIGSDPLLQE